MGAGAGLAGSSTSSQVEGCDPPDPKLGLILGVGAYFQHRIVKLRTIEWQRLCERLVSYVMGQLVVIGAVVEPDIAELGLWGGFSAIVGVLGVYAGARGRGKKSGAPGGGRRYELARGARCAVGRARSNDVALSDQKVPRHLPEIA